MAAASWRRAGWGLLRSRAVFRHQLCPAQRAFRVVPVQRRASDEQKQPPPQEHAESQPVAEQRDREYPYSRPSYTDQGGEESEDDEGEAQLQHRILTAALEFVPSHGWTADAIAEGAKSLGLSVAAAGLFHQDGSELVLHFVSQGNAKLSQLLEEQHKLVQLGQAEKKKTDQFLKDALEARLRMLIPYIEKWPQAISLLLMPHNIPASLNLLTNMVDDMWHYAGDQSTDAQAFPNFGPSDVLDRNSQNSKLRLPTGRSLDMPGRFNWYTRRAVLAGIYNTTELVMIQDTSPDFEDTWLFLQNRIADAMSMGHTAKQAQATGETLVQGLMGAAVTLRNLTGLNQR